MNVEEKVKTNTTNVMLRFAAIRDVIDLIDELVDHAEYDPSTATYQLIKLIREFATCHHPAMEQIYEDFSHSESLRVVNLHRNLVALYVNEELQAANELPSEFLSDDVIAILHTAAKTKDKR
mgnify:CR=1 FL=1